MPARRRRTAFRTPSQRAEMWKQKMDGQTYARILNATKPLALPRVTEYQADHEHLISTVKSVLEPLGLTPQTHQYVWYAQELYKAARTYGGNALKKEVNATYAKYLAKGLNDDALKEVASRVAVAPDPITDIFKLEVAPKSKCIIGFSEAGFVIPAGSIVQHQAFSEKTGASRGFVLPYSGTAKKLKVYVLTNTLNNFAYVQCRKNEGQEVIEVEIPAGETGTFSNDIDTLSFEENDRIDFVIDTLRAEEGEIDIVSVSLLYEA